MGPVNSGVMVRFGSEVYIRTLGRHWEVWYGKGLISESNYVQCPRRWSRPPSPSSGHWSLSFHPLGLPTGRHSFLLPGREGNIATTGREAVVLATAAKQQPEPITPLRSLYSIYFFFFFCPTGWLGSYIDRRWRLPHPILAPPQRRKAVLTCFLFLSACLPSVLPVRLVRNSGIWVG